MARSHKGRSATAPRMVKVGLRRASMEEGACRIYHMRYLVTSGFTYCPWCAEELVMRFHCEHCDRNFTSEASYKAHLNNINLFLANPCPLQRDDETRHSIRWLKNRRRFYCTACKHEYKQQREETTDAKLPSSQ